MSKTAATDDWHDLHGSGACFEWVLSLNRELQIDHTYAFVSRLIPHHLPVFIVAELSNTTARSRLF
jgi:hypothetical protein